MFTENDDRVGFATNASGEGQFSSKAQMKIYELINPRQLFTDLCYE